MSGSMYEKFLLIPAFSYLGEFLKAAKRSPAGLLLHRTELRIRDVYLGYQILIIIHPGSRIQQQNQKEEGEKIVVLPFLTGTEKNLSQLLKNYFTFLSKNSQ